QAFVIQDAARIPDAPYRLPNKSNVSTTPRKRLKNLIGPDSRKNLDQFAGVDGAEQLGRSGHVAAIARTPDIALARGLARKANALKRAQGARSRDIWRLTRHLIHPAPCA